MAFQRSGRRKDSGLVQPEVSEAETANLGLVCFKKCCCDVCSLRKYPVFWLRGKVVRGLGRLRGSELTQAFAACAHGTWRSEFRHELVHELHCGLANNRKALTWRPGLADQSERCCDSASIGRLGEGRTRGSGREICTATESASIRLKCVARMSSWDPTYSSLGLEAQNGEGGVPLTACTTTLECCCFGSCAFARRQLRQPRARAMQCVLDCIIRPWPRVLEHLETFQRLFFGGSQPSP